MADKISSDDKETSLYLIQIRYLDEQLERCQLKCDKLEKQNKDLAAQYSVLEKDKKDITEYLKRSVVAKEKKVDELAERLESQQQAAEQDSEALKLQHSRYMQELQERVDELNSESRMHAAKFEEQKEQLMQLMQLMQQLSDMESLKKQLVSEKEEHEAAIHSLKEEAGLEKEKMIEEIQNTVDDFVQTKTSNILQEERTEHGERAEQLHFLLKESVVLRKEKDDLRGRGSDLCFERDHLKKDLNKITKESFTRKKEVKQLTKTCQQLEVELKDCSTTHEHMLAKEEALRQRLASMSEECRQKTAEAGQLGAEAQRERSRRKQLEGDMQEAVIILRHIVTDSEKASETQWTRLLEILESTAPQGTGSTLKDSTEKGSRGHKPQTTDPKPARAETLNLATDPLFLMARYRLGDLGLVPRPTWEHKPATSRTGARSTSTQLPLNRKLCSQKISSSFDPSAPAPQQADPEAGASTSAD